MSTWSFLKAAVRDPKKVGAIAPSGPVLAAAMWNRAEVQPGQVVVEIGGGSGALTTVFLQRLPHDCTFLCLEPDAELAAVLRKRFEGLDVVEEFATELPRVLADRGLDRADVVLSGLPFAIWSQEVQEANLDAVVEVLADGGRLVTFTYLQSPLLPAGRRFRETLGSRFSEVGATKTVWRNVPPAFAYVCAGPNRRAG